MNTKPKEDFLTSHELMINHNTNFLYAHHIQKYQLWM